MIPDFIDIRFLDILDIFLVSILIFQLYKLVRGTVAIRIFIGILAIYMIWKLVGFFKMALLTEILGQFIGVGVIALIIVFQQELRKFLLLIGTTRFWSDKSKRNRWGWNAKKAVLDTDAIVKACWTMGSTKTGALIVISENPDPALMNSGDAFDSNLSVRIIENIFFKNSPMHDGAVIISNNRILAARCVLPVTESEDFPSHLGMRHRSAAGVSETTDSIAIVVSEQTGHIPYCKDGHIFLDVDETELKTVLEKEFNS